MNVKVSTLFQIELTQEEAEYVVSALKDRTAYSGGGPEWVCLNQLKKNLSLHLGKKDE
jgi:hypothetical protein